MSEGERRDARKLAPFVEPELSEARIARQWEHISNGYRPRAALRMRAWAVAASATVLVLSVIVFSRTIRGPGGAGALDDAVLASGADSVSLSLGEGSAIDLEPKSELRFVERSEKSVRIALEQGSARFEVAHLEGRRFSVIAADVEVVVVGTRFSVMRGPGSAGEEIRVAVERGIVEVRSKSSARPPVRISAGESWSSSDAATAEDEGDETPDPQDADAAEESGSATIASREVPPIGRGISSKDGVRSKRVHKRRPRTAKLDARQMFDSANIARRAGLVREAAQKYETLLERFPRDGRAGLAAFELGRLRMDSLADPDGAASALSKAIALAPEASFVEDAMARLVYAEEARGGGERCDKARTKYLDQYPRGVHAASIIQRCKSR